jgi:hypothetical protein
VLDTRTCKVINRVATTLRLAAQSVGRTDTCLGIFYRRKKSHLGPAKATTATARKLACLVYHLLKYKRPIPRTRPRHLPTQIGKNHPSQTSETSHFTWLPAFTKRPGPRLIPLFTV